MQAASGRKTTVFVSYRREGGFVLAKYIFDHLYAAGYDVFMDVHSLGAGEFEQTTLAEVAARDYFLLVLTSGSLERMIRENDWLRKELMQAVKSGRTVVPVLAEDFKFEDHRVQKALEKLPPALQALPTFNAIRIPPPEYFDSAMNRLVSFLKAIADSAPSHGTNKSSSTAAAPKSVAQAQSALHRLTLPPVASLTKTQSATPWSDLEPKLAGTGVVGVDTPTLKKPVAPARLPAPTLTNGVFGLTWTEVSKADKYVLEESGDAEFKNPGKVVYQGPRMSWMDLSAGPFNRPSRIGLTLPAPSKYYRVKAIGKGGAGESDWSNIVTIVAAKPVAPARLPAPTLTKGIFGAVFSVTWTEVSKADKYVLEESGDAEFKNPGKVVYQGPRTSWIDHLSAGPFNRPSRIGLTLPAPSKYYRVKAISKGGAGESDWSNIVTIVAAKPVAPARLPAPTLTKGIFGAVFSVTWTEVSKAGKYVLEESGDAEFKNPGKVVYQGPRTFWIGHLSADPLNKPTPIGLRLRGPSKYYRVKAISKGGAGESDWSNIVGGRDSN